MLGEFTLRTGKTQLFELPDPQYTLDMYEYDYEDDFECRFPM